MPAKKKTSAKPKERAANSAKVKPDGKLRLKLHRATSAREFRIAMGLKDESDYKIHALLKAI